MDRIAGLANGFFSSHGLAHAISYFAWVNLKGSLISLAIGGAVYLLIARPLLSRARPDGGVDILVPVGRHAAHGGKRHAGAADAGIEAQLRDVERIAARTGRIRRAAKQITQQHMVLSSLFVKAIR